MKQVETKDTGAEKIFRDHRIWWLAIFAILGAIVFQSKYQETFPTAALDLSVPRRQIAEIAKDWSHKLGYSKANTIDSTTFFEDESVKTYLEFEMGSQRGPELMRAEIPVWMWVSRFCREHEQEECTVFLAPDGTFLKFKHVVPNDLFLPTVSHDEAERLARDFIEKTAKHSLDGYRLIGDETSTQLKRKDHRFIWENRQVDYKGARQRLRAEVDGNQVNAFSQQLNLPEEWNRRYEKMRSYNLQLFNIANACYNVLIAIAAIAFLWAVTHHKIRWQVTIIFAAVFALIQVLESLNSFPTIVSQYEPLKLGYNAYITDQLLARIFAMAGLFVIGVIFAGSAEVIYRMCWPKRMAMENWCKPAALGSTEVCRGLVVGHLAPFLYVGWVITYYLLGKHIGFYTPLSVENYRALASSLVPAFSAVALGVFASSHEEIVYRVVALNLSLKLLEKVPGLAKHKAARFWLCNLLQAAAWGFMHSTYPQQPSYARGLELTCSGMLFGWLFQTFGLLPCIVSHYLVDCYLTSRVLLDSAQPSLAISAVVANSPFFIVAVCAFVLRRKMLNRDFLPQFTNERVSELQYREVVPEVEHPKHFDYRPLSASRRKWLAVAAICALLLSIWSWKPMVVGRNTRLTVSRAEAEKIASRALRARGENPAEFQRVTWLIADSVGEELQYVFENEGREKTVRYASLEDFGFTWLVRYFKPLQIKEYKALIDSRGQEYSFNITEGEDVAGASLSEPVATKIAEGYIWKNHREYLPLKFDSVQETRREKRIDFRIFFEAPLLKVGDAPCKEQVRLLGDKVAEFKQGWELPDTWKENFEKKTTKDEVANVVLMIYRLLLVVLGVWWLIGLLRSGAVRWRLPFVMGGVILVLAIANEWNATLVVLQDYPTSNSMDTFVSKQLMESLLKLLWMSVLTIIPGALALAVFKLSAPETSIYAVLRTGCRPADQFERRQQRQLWLDAIICGYGIAILRWSCSMISGGVESLVSPAVQVASFWAVTRFANVHYPQIDLAVECFNRAIRESFNTAVFVGLYQKYCGSLRKGLMIVSLMMLVQYCQERYWQDYLVGYAHSLVDWIIFYLFVAKFARKNIFAYFMYGFANEIIGRLPILAMHAPRVMFSEMIWCAGFLLGPLAWLIWLFSNKITSGTSPLSAAAAPSSET